MVLPEPKYISGATVLVLLARKSRILRVELKTSKVDPDLTNNSMQKSPVPNAKSVLAGTVNLSPEPSKTTLAEPIA